jgi:hypothetical protein
MSKPCIVTFALITALGFSTAVDARPATATPSDQVHHDVSASRHRILKPGDRNCLQSTGSLIPPRKGECLPVAGRSYSGRELRRTGAIDTAHALQMLDPSISLGH